MRTIRRTFGLLALLAALLTPAQLFAQTVMTATTLAAAVSTISQSPVTVASATGITAPASGATLVYLLVDRELMQVQSVSGVQIGVIRGAAGTRAATHISGVAVLVVPGQALQSYVPSGQCTRTNQLYVPWVVSGGAGLGVEGGTTWDCLGVTTAGQWANVNFNYTPGVLGSTMASTAGTLGAFTGTIFTVSGTNAITGFTNPAGIGVGFCVQIVPSGIFTWTAAGNIALAGTAVVNKLLTFCWNGTKWIPSYIA